MLFVMRDIEQMKGKCRCNSTLKTSVCLKSSVVPHGPNLGKEFKENLGQTILHGYQACAISLGAQLGIFNRMAEFKEGKTSQEIADALKFKERYIREWLGAMVCAEIIDYDAEKKTYILPAFRQPYLVTNGKESITAFGLGMTIAAGALPEVAKCFDLDGPRGVPYSSYKGFHEWRKMRVGCQMHETFLIDLYKQDEDLMKKLESGISVCEYGCSTGEQLFLLADLFPNSTFYGSDIDEESILGAQKRAGESNKTNISFGVEDLCNLPNDWTDKWDFSLVFDVIHDLPQPAKGLSEAYRVLKPGGKFFMMDIGLSSNLEENIGIEGAATMSMSLMHCMPVSLHHKDGAGLGNAWGTQKAREMVIENGFSDVKELKGEGNFCYFMCLK